MTSVDRSTKTTLSTYNPQIQVSRLQRIRHFQHRKFRCAIKHFTDSAGSHAQIGRDLMLAFNVGGVVIAA